MRAGRPVAKARLKRTSPPSPSSPTGIPTHSGKWNDVEPRDQRHQSYPIAKRMNARLRHETYPRDEIEFWRLKMQFESGFPNSVHGSIRPWINHLQRGGGKKGSFQCCTDSTGEEILYLRAIQGHSVENLHDPSLHDNVLIPDNFFEYIYRVGNSLDMHSITDSGLTAGSKNASQDRQTVLFTAVNPSAAHCHEEKEFDLTKPRIAAYKQQWKVHQCAVYCVDIRLAQRQGLKFFQTRSKTPSLSMTLYHQSVLKEWCPQ